MMNNKVTFVLIFLFTAPLAFATIYQWQDENGQTHYGQEPPPNAKTTVIKTPYTAPSSSAAQEIANTQKLLKEQQEAAQKAQIANEKAKAQESAAKLRATNCERAKAHLFDIESHNRVRMQDATGNVTQLTPDERDDDITRTKAAVQEYCSPAQTP